MRDFGIMDAVLVLGMFDLSGRSVAWLARLFRVQEVGSSNLPAPTISQNFQGLLHSFLKVGCHAIVVWLHGHIYTPMK